MKMKYFYFLLSPYLETQTLVVQGSPVQIKQGSQRTRLFFQSAFIQNCQRCFFYRSPKDWFYTVYTHYGHSLLKADLVTHIFPAAGPPSLDMPPTCHPSVWSQTKEREGDRGKQSIANAERERKRKRCLKIWQCHLWHDRVPRRRRETRLKKKNVWTKEVELRGAAVL